MSFVVLVTNRLRGPRLLRGLRVPSWRFLSSLRRLCRRGPKKGGLTIVLPVSKPTMSAHFSVLLEADLIESEKTGRTIVYRLKMSVLEDALLGFAQTFGWTMKSEKPGGLVRSVARRPRAIKREA